MKLHPAFLLAPCLAVAIGCGNDDVVSPPEPIPAGAMTYAGYDEEGTQIVEGWVLLDLATISQEPGVPVNVTGTWQLRRVGPAGDVGPQVGSGTLEGALVDSQLYVNFNPTRTDDNVTADGTLEVWVGPKDDLRWGGFWRWSTLEGIRRSGSFAAER